MMEPQWTKNHDITNLGAFYLWSDQFATNPTVKGTSTYNIFSTIFVQINRGDQDNTLCIQCSGISHLWIQST